MEIKEWLEVFSDLINRIRKFGTAESFVSMKELQILRRKIPFNKEKFSFLISLRASYQNALNAGFIKPNVQKRIVCWLNALEVLSYAIVMNESQTFERFLKSDINSYASLANEMVSYFTSQERQEEFAKFFMSHKQILLAEFGS